MKKLILSLLIFCSAFVSAQISIPQVTGLPAALNSKVDKATGKSLIADTLVAKIQPHVTNLSNPHSVTKSQVGLGNVDNTSDANKPISSATQTALNGKQNAGTYSTDIHSNITALNAVSGINTGDETLTSIKTKLGAASAVSDGYLTYNMFNIFNGKEPSFTKNTAFNKNLGTTPGTVLEGRTFGTAANSMVGDFQPAITGLSTNYLPKWNGSSFVNSKAIDDGATYKITNTGNSNLLLHSTATNGKNWSINSRSDGYFLLGVYGVADYLYFKPSGDIVMNNTTQSTSPTTGALVVGGGVGADHVIANNFYGSGSNLTGVQKPITLTTNGTSGAATFSGNTLNVPNYGSSTTGGTFGSAYTNVSNTVISVNPVAFYTNISGIFTASVKISVTSTATGKCIFRVSLPQTPYGYQSIVVQGSDSGKTTNYNMFVDNSGTNYVDIAFLASTSSSSIIVNIMAVGN